jgi:hypothetical protein
MNFICCFHCTNIITVSLSSAYNHEELGAEEHKPLHGAETYTESGFQQTTETNQRSSITPHPTSIQKHKLTYYLLPPKHQSCTRVHIQKHNVAIVNSQTQFLPYKYNPTHIQISQNLNPHIDFTKPQPTRVHKKSSTTITIPNPKHQIHNTQPNPTKSSTN